MNFIVIETEGRCMTFRGGLLEGRRFSCGEVLFVEGDMISFAPGNPQGTWCLQSTFHKGRPAISCAFFNKRTGRMEERYFKIFKYDGMFMCGPKFPKPLDEEAYSRRCAQKLAA